MKKFKDSIFNKFMRKLPTIIVILMSTTLVVLMCEPYKLFKSVDPIKVSYNKENPSELSKVESEAVDLVNNISIDDLKKIYDSLMTERVNLLLYKFNSYSILNSLSLSDFNVFIIRTLKLDSISSELRTHIMANVYYLVIIRGDNEFNNLNKLKVKDLSTYKFEMFEIK